MMRQTSVSHSSFQTLAGLSGILSLAIIITYSLCFMVYLRAEISLQNGGLQLINSSDFQLAGLSCTVSILSVIFMILYIVEKERLTNISTNYDYSSLIPSANSGNFVGTSITMQKLRQHHRNTSLILKTAIFLQIIELVSAIMFFRDAVFFEPVAGFSLDLIYPHQFQVNSANNANYTFMEKYIYLGQSTPSLGFSTMESTDYNFLRVQQYQYQVNQFFNTHRFSLQKIQSIEYFNSNDSYQFALEMDSLVTTCNEKESCEINAEMIIVGQGYGYGMKGKIETKVRVLATADASKIASNVEYHTIRVFMSSFEHLVKVSRVFIMFATLSGVFLSTGVVVWYRFITAK